MHSEPYYGSNRTTWAYRLNLLPKVMPLGVWKLAVETASLRWGCRLRLSTRAAKMLLPPKKRAQLRRCEITAFDGKPVPKGLRSCPENVRPHRIKAAVRQLRPQFCCPRPRQSQGPRQRQSQWPHQRQTQCPRQRQSQCPRQRHTP
jgi:hypothetical protein